MASVSVITIVKDHAAGLEATHQSLLDQSFIDWEMVIVIGVSIDATLAVAKNLQRIESRIRLIEQNGSGIYLSLIHI